MLMKFARNLRENIVKCLKNIQEILRNNQLQYKKITIF